jgi:hypothetical protein
MYIFINLILDELTTDDKQKFYLFTKEVESKIKLFKRNFNIDVIWKGLHYDWVNDY